jgi:DNA uptake protein ComE-like DNA-binding protein
MSPIKINTTETSTNPSEKLCVQSAITKANPTLANTNATKKQININKNVLKAAPAFAKINSEVSTV